MAGDKPLTPLNRFVFREFFKAALMPLLCIELALVLLYFGINSYNQQNASQTLESEITSHLEVIGSNKTRILTEQLKAITDLTELLGRHTTLFFNDNYPLELNEKEDTAEYGFADNGMYYKKNNNGGSSLFYSSRTKITDAEKEKARRSEILDPLFKDVFEANKNIVAVYFNSFDSMSRYYPFIDKVYEQFLPDLNIPEFNFYYLADEKHNPDRGVVWTETYLDPAGQGWMMSCIVPVYRGDFLEGVVGIDVTIKKFIDNMLNLQLQWDAQAFLVDGKGTIMAMPPGVEALFGLTELREYTYRERVAHDTYKPEEFNLLKTQAPGVADRIREILAAEKVAVEIRIDEKSYLLSQVTEPLTGWKLMVLAERARFLEPMSLLEKNARRIGFAAIGAMVVFYAAFFFYLLYKAKRISKQIAAPVTNIAEQSKRILDGDYNISSERSGILELDVLNSSFSTMVEEIKELHETLREEIGRANVELEERKLVQDALKKSEEKLYGIFNHTLEFIGLLDKDGIVSDANKTALDFVGVSENEVVDKPFWETPWFSHSPEAQQKLKEAIGQAKRGELARFETTHPRQDGEIEHVDVSIVPVKDKDGEVVMMIPESRIITDLKRIQEELIVARDAAEAANVAKTEFIGNMSHELRTPLNHILGFTNIVLDKNFGPLNERQEKFLRNVLESGKVLLALVNDLLDIAQIESGHDELNLQTFNIHDVLEHSFAMIKEKAAKKNIELKLHVDQAPENLYGDERKIKQVLYNLLSNAVKFTPQKGVIALMAKMVQDESGDNAGQGMKYIQVSVTDSGVGVDADNLERIFVNFEQVETSLSRSFQGAGVGLPLTKHLVEMHGGRIWAESEGKDKGTTFSFTIPVRSVTV